MSVLVKSFRFPPVIIHRSPSHENCDTAAAPRKTSQHATAEDGKTTMIFLLSQVFSINDRLILFYFFFFYFSSHGNEKNEIYRVKIGRKNSDIRNKSRCAPRKIRTAIDQSKINNRLMQSKTRHPPYLTVCRYTNGNQKVAPLS